METAASGRVNAYTKTAPVAPYDLCRSLMDCEETPGAVTTRYVLVSVNEPSDADDAEVLKNDAQWPK